MKRLQQFYFLIKPYWFSRQRWPAIALLATVLTLSLSSVWFTVRLNEWNGRFYNALQALDADAIYPLLRDFILIIGAFILVMVYAEYLRKKVLINWREWMTRQLCERWLSGNQCHYRMQLAQQQPDNPDQRIAEDVRLLIDDSLDLLLSFLRSVLTLVSFVTILWGLSGSLEFSVAGMDISIAGYMVWACLLYTLTGTLITHWIGRPLQHLNFSQQKREADLRAALLQRKEYSQAIAGQKGERWDNRQLQGVFKTVADNWYQLMGRERNLGFFTIGYSQLTMLVPLFFALPKFLSGAIQLGGLMQIRMAFGQVSGALGWFIYAYKDIARWSASVERLYDFVQLLDQQQVNNVQQAADHDRDDSDVLLDAPCLKLRKPDQKFLLNTPSISLEPASLTLIQGRSGLGKSTWLGALAGLWPHHDGHIKRHSSLLWVPQRLYLPKTSLKELIAYPASSNDFLSDECRKVLVACGLPELAEQLELTCDWQGRLSSGEQQRIMFARLLLNQPAVALLDETTSALDQDSARQLLQLIRQTETAVVLVSHQTFLSDCVDRLVELDSDAAEESAGRLEPAKPVTDEDPVVEDQPTAEVYA
ncbi:ABC transporter ATP-binding protein/permease [Endozoicomonadaceae bacterium StTr2]